MEPTAIYPNIKLADLGAGSQMALFGFRACAMGRVKCCCVVRTFNEVFGDDRGGQVLGKTLQLARHLGNDGSRRLKLSAPGCIRFTHDETSVLGALAAAQDNDQSLRDSHLTWLLSCHPKPCLCETVDTLASMFASRDLLVQLPEVRGVRATDGEIASLACVGHA